jgi:hypothetical protein
MARPAILKIDIITDAKKAQAGLQQTQSTVSKVTGKIKSSFLTAASAAGIAFGAGAVVQGIKGTIDAASNLNETVNKSSVIFGSQADAMLKWSANSARTMGLSQQAALDTATTFGDMFRQLGFAGDQAASMSQGIVALAADLGSFNNLPTGQVADMIAASFRGEYDSLQRIIPNINAARVNQEALNMTHKGSVKELTGAEKAAATLAIIQKDGARAAGDFARTSDALANKQKILAAETENVKAKIGTALLPVVLTVIGAILSFGSAIGDVVNFIAANQQVFLALAIGIGAIGVVILASVIPAFLAWAASALAAAAATLLAIAPFIAIGAVVAVIAYLIIRNWTTIKTVTASVWNFILSAISGVWNWIKSNWPMLLAILTGPFGVAVLIIARNWQSILSAASGVLDWFKGMAGKIGSALSGIAHAISAPFIAGFNAVRDAVEAAVRWIADRINWVKDVVSSGIRAAKDLYNAFARVWNGFEVTIGKIEVAGKTVFGGATIGLPDLPMLAGGAYVNRATLAVIGEGRGGEYVLPEAKLRRELARAGGNTYQINVNVDPTANRAEVGRAVVEAIRSFERAAGRDWRAAT